MSIMPYESSTLAVNAVGAAQDVADTINDAFLVVEGVNDLARLGVHLALTVEAGAIGAEVTLTSATRHLLPSLVRQFDAPGIHWTSPTVVEALGSMCEGRITVRITSPAPASGNERKAA
ncbi:hypothetical protein [Streptomyces antarcticus]|uniref:hypothetical protein n=1 Tax=Streptomyces antarcticus TaxID=2996458 RepID=UPI00226EB675|nr:MULTISPECIES: hypothetical protein [unclassified Streptomyces]MCY0947279.1 hypothetical protein [Streptomyces sp. H34-AA3]MCZ4086524.1 hypothetical protein [Streptomyces sp. H34-S5]